LQFDPQASFAPAAYYVTDLMVNNEVSLSINQLVGTVIYSAVTRTIAYTTYCDSEAVSSSFLSGEWSMDEQWQVETALYVVDITTMALTEVIPCGGGSQFSISFSPDGKQILLIWVDNAWELYRIELDTLMLINLTS
jgi:Tol biopolymer transport system component